MYHVSLRFLVEGRAGYWPCQPKASVSKQRVPCEVVDESYVAVAVAVLCPLFVLSLEVVEV